MPGVSGNQLTDAALSQALDLGLEIELEDITSLYKLEDGSFIASTGKREYAAKAVILATGAKHRPLGVAREEELTGHGVSYCALCDGAFHKGEDVAVVGGGNSAAQAAVFLADLCKSVTVIQNFDHFTCDQRDLDAMRARENIHFCLSSRVTALEGDERLRAVRLTHEQSGAATELPVTGLFICIGRMADNAPFDNLVVLDPQGFILAGEDCRTNVPGLLRRGRLPRQGSAPANHRRCGRRNRRHRRMPVYRIIKKAYKNPRLNECAFRSAEGFFALYACPRASSSAICTAFVAAPLRT